MTPETNCPKCGNKFATKIGEQNVCPKCLFKFAMKKTDLSDSDNSVKQEKITAGEPVLPAGTKLGQYEIKEMLGRGGMGTVYKAYQPPLERFVAIKILPAKLATDREFLTRFNREAKALAGLSHPNIVSIYDICQNEGYFYFVMEFVEGVTARQLIEERTLPPEEALKIVPQLCDALEYAHSEGIVHRDIKPENILIDKKGKVKIADFGLAQIVRGDIMIDPVTKTKEVMGTTDYMAPEQRMKTKDVDHRVDIYSLGVVFYEMLTGELPIGKFELPSRKVQIDVRVDDIVMKTLEREPQKRYQRASEVGKAVTEVISGISKPETPGQDDKKTVKSGDISQGARYSTLSILSFIFAFIPACITQILGIIFGIVAIIKINRSAGQLKGTGLAIAGIVISIIVGTIISLMILVFISNFVEGESITVYNTVPEEKQQTTIKMEEKELKFREFVKAAMNTMESAKNTADASKKKELYQETINNLKSALSIKDDPEVRKLINEYSERYEKEQVEINKQQMEAKKQQLAQSLEIAKTIKDVDERDKTIYTIALQYAGIGEYDKAIETVKLIEGNNQWKSQALCQIINNYVRSGPKYVDILNQLLEIVQTIKDERGQVETMYHVAVKYAEIGEFDKAIEITTKLINNDYWKSEALQRINKVKVKNKLKSQEEIEKTKADAQKSIQEIVQKRRKDWQILNDDISKWVRTGASSSEIYVDDKNQLILKNPSGNTQATVLNNNNNGDNWKDFTLTIEFKMVSGSLDMGLKGMEIPFPKKFKVEWQRYTIEVKGDELTISGADDMEQPKTTKVNTNALPIIIVAKPGDEIIIKELKVKIIE
ncbi:MAG: protein kinase [Planctomycetota bacterium]